jgi:hypothetical protein
MKLITALMVLLFTTLSFSQFGVTFDVDRGFASNIFSNYRQLPDNVNRLQGKLYFDNTSKSQGLRAFYNASGALYEKYDYKSYQLHTLGLSFYNYASELGDRINAGIDASTRLHSKDYKYYEYQQGRAFASAKLLLTRQIFGYAGTNFRTRNYTSLAPYSYWQNISYLRLSRFFDSGTTIIAEADYMLKQYTDVNAAPIQDFSEIYTEGNGKSQQFVGLLKIAQALNAKTGLSLQTLVRRNLESSVRYLIDDAGYYYSDDELFDDVFGYEAEQVTLSLKRKLPWKMQATIGGSYIQKHYSNRVALDFDGYAIDNAGLREDNRSIGWLTLNKRWQYSTYMAPVNLEFNFTFLNNGSNDPYYKFQSRYVSFGISQSF